MIKLFIVALFLCICTVLMITSENSESGYSPLGRMVLTEQLIDTKAIVPTIAPAPSSEDKQEGLAITSISVPYYWEGIDGGEKGSYDMIGDGDVPPISSLFSNEYSRYLWSLWNNDSPENLGDKENMHSEEIPLVDGIERCSGDSCSINNCVIHKQDEHYIVLCNSLEIDSDYKLTEGSSLVATTCRIAAGGKEADAYCLFRDFLSELHSRKLLSDSRCGTPDSLLYCDFDIFKEKIYCENGTCSYVYPVIDQDIQSVLRLLN